MARFFLPDILTPHSGFMFSSLLFTKEKKGSSQKSLLELSHPLLHVCRFLGSH